MLSEIEVRKAEATATVVVKRARVTGAQLPELFDATFARLHAAIAEGVVIPAGAPFALCTRMEQTLDVEIGFPGTLAQPDPNLEKSELPGGTIARAQYWGSYEGLPLAWAELTAMIAGRGLEIVGPCWESYETKPTPELDPAELRTDLCCVVA